MTDEPSNLVLEHLRAIRDDLTDVRRRLGNIEIEAAQHSRLMSVLIDGQSHHRIRFAELEQRLERVERRLGLIDNPS